MLPSAADGFRTKYRVKKMSVSISGTTGIELSILNYKILEYQKINFFE